MMDIDKLRAIINTRIGEIDEYLVQLCEDRATCRKEGDISGLNALYEISSENLGRRDELVRLLNVLHPEGY